MKIKINEEETYENSKEEYTIEELSSLIDNLKEISETPVLTKKKKAGRPKLDEPTQGGFPVLSPRVKKKRRKQMVRWDDRDEVLKALRIHYHGTKGEKLAYARDKGMDWNQLMKGFSGLKKRYNVTPQEIGLQTYPSRSEKYVKTVEKQKQETEPKTKKKADGLVSLNLHHEVKEAVSDGKIPEELAKAYNLLNKEDQLKFFKLFSLTHRGLDMQIKALKDFSSLDEKGKEEIRQNLKNL